MRTTPRHRTNLRPKRVLLTFVFALMLFPSLAGATPPGTREVRSYPGGYSAIQYTPASLDRSKPAPLFVMVHGCGTTAAQQESANLLDEQAERDGFVVLYPDHDQNPALHPLGCWRFYSESSRTSPDPAGIVATVKDAIARSSPPIDPSRVYYAGMSSGAIIGSIIAGTYPDVFAAFMLNAGCPFRTGATCIEAPPVAPAAELAREAFDAMGTNKRVVPVLVSQGDNDHTINPAQLDRDRDQWRMTNNLVIDGTLDSPIPATPTRTRIDAPAGRRQSDVEQYDDTAGCTIIERWQIRDMDHFWPGGSSAPASAPFVDPTAPNGGDIAWNFFKRYHLSPGSLNPCIPPAPAAARACAATVRLRIKLPASVRAVVVRVGNARRKSTRHGTVLALTVRRSLTKTVKVTVTGTFKRGTFKRHRTIKPCA